MKIVFYLVWIVSWIIHVHALWNQKYHTQKISLGILYRPTPVIIWPTLYVCQFFHTSPMSARRCWVLDIRASYKRRRRAVVTHRVGLNEYVHSRNILLGDFRLSILAIDGGCCRHVQFLRSGQIALILSMVFSRVVPLDVTQQGSQWTKVRRSLVSRSMHVSFSQGQLTDRSPKNAWMGLTDAMWLIGVSYALQSDGH